MSTKQPSVKGNKRGKKKLATSKDTPDTDEEAKGPCNPIVDAFRASQISLKTTH